MAKSHNSTSLLAVRWSVSCTLTTAAFTGGTARWIEKAISDLLCWASTHSVSRIPGPLLTRWVRLAISSTRPDDHEYLSERVSTAVAHTHRIPSPSCSVKDPTRAEKKERLKSMHAKLR